MPIRVDYNLVGDLGHLAVESGKGQDFWRKFQAEQSLVNSMREHQIRQDALALEQVRQNYAMQLRNQSVRSGSGPMVRSVAAQKPSTRTGFDFSKFPNLNLDPQSQEQLSLAMQMGDKEMFREILSRGMQGRTPAPGGTGEIIAGPETFRVEDDAVLGERRFIDPSGQEQVEEIPVERRGGFVSATQPTQGVTPEVAQKHAFIQSLDVAPSIKQSLSVMASSPDVDMGELATKANQMLSEERIGKSQTQNVRIDAYDADIKDIDDRIRSLEKSVELYQRRSLTELLRTRPAEMSPVEKQALIDYNKLRKRRELLRQRQREIAFGQATKSQMISSPQNPTSLPTPTTTGSRTDRLIEVLNSLDISK